MTNDLFIESEFHFQISGTEHEITTDDGARLATVSLMGRRELDDADAHAHRAPSITNQFTTFQMLSIDQHRANNVN